LVFNCEKLEIDKSAVETDSKISGLLSERQVEGKFAFDILLRDKFPFQPPIVMTKTKFCEPSLADGRDLLLHILPKDISEWRPSMNLYELIQQIPEFIRETLLQ